jgi:hypothetical protein
MCSIYTRIGGHLNITYTEKLRKQNSGFQVILLVASNELANLNFTKAVFLLCTYRNLT